MDYCSFPKEQSALEVGSKCWRGARYIANLAPINSKSSRSLVALTL
jgi:hypothetical protein